MALLKFSKNAKKLKQLDLSYNSNATKILFQIPQYCESLEVLKLRGIEDCKLQKFSDGCCGRLRHIWLDGARLRSSSLWSFVHGMAQLRTLSLDKASEVDNQFLIHIADNCPNLTYLDLSNTKVSDLSKLVMECRQLETVMLKKLNITDDDVIGLSQSCPNLRVLHLFDNCKIGDPAIAALAQNSAALQSLSINYCRKISNTGLAMLVSCGALEELSVNSTRANDEGLWPLIEGCPNLRLIRCRGTRVSYKILELEHIVIET